MKRWAFLRLSVGGRAGPLRRLNSLGFRWSFEIDWWMVPRMAGPSCCGSTILTMFLYRTLSYHAYRGIERRISRFSQEFYAATGRSVAPRVFCGRRATVLTRSVYGVDVNFGFCGYVRLLAISRVTWWDFWCGVHLWGDGAVEENALPPRTPRAPRG